MDVPAATAPAIHTRQLTDGAGQRRFYGQFCRIGSGAACAFAFRFGRGVSLAHPRVTIYSGLTLWKVPGQMSYAGSEPTTTVRRDSLLLVLLALLTALAFQPSLGCGFNADDDLLVTQQPHVNSGLTLRNVRWALTTHELGYPIPVTLISFMVDSSVYGLNATGFHAENVFWHIGNVLLLYLLLRRMTGDAWRARLSRQSLPFIPFGQSRSHG